MEAIQQLRKKYEALRSEPKVVKTEWGFDIYVFPLTVAEASKLQKLAGNEDLSSLIDILVIRGKDSSGNPLFTEDQKEEIAEIVDPKRLAEVIEQMVKDVEQEFGESDLKNS